MKVTVDVTVAVAPSELDDVLDNIIAAIEFSTESIQGVEEVEADVEAVKDGYEDA